MTGYLKLAVTSLLFFGLAQARGADGDGKYLPKKIELDFKRLFKEISFDEKTLAKLPSVLFVSGQSFSKRNLSVINRVHFFKGRLFDVWFMKQSEEGHSFDFNNWTSLAILVDKKTSPKTAYYLQFKDEVLRPHVAPRFSGYSARCFTCHSGGPRVMRPKSSRLVPVFNGKELRWLRSWNKAIANYRVVKTYKPAFNPASDELSIFRPGMIDNEQVQHRVCTECHSSSGVRAALLRQHRDSIAALLDNGSDPHGFYVSAPNENLAFMPLDGPKLSQEDRLCLDDWLNNTGDRPPKAGCNEKGEAVGGAQTQLMVDGADTRLEAFADSTFGKIKLSHFYVSGFANCSRGKDGPGPCQGEVRVDLRQVQTGITLRDRHLKEKYLHVSDHPFAIFSFEKQAPGQLKGILDLNGIPIGYPVRLNCQSTGMRQKCKLLDFEINLASHHIDRPQFLGSVVTNRVFVGGEIVLKEIR